MYNKSNNRLIKLGEVTFTCNGDYEDAEQSSSCSLDSLPFYPAIDLEKHAIYPDELVFKREEVPGSPDDYTSINANVFSVWNGKGDNERRRLGQQAHPNLIKQALLDSTKFVGAAVGMWRPEPGSTYPNLAVQAGGLRTLITNTTIPTGAPCIVYLEDPDVMLKDPQRTMRTKDKERFVADIKAVDPKELGEIFMQQYSEILKNGERWRAARNTTHPTTGAWNYAVRATMQSQAMMCLSFLKVMLDNKKIRLEEGTFAELGLSETAHSVDQVTALALHMDVIEDKESAYADYEYQNLWRDVLLTGMSEGVSDDYYIGRVPDGQPVGFNEETKRVTEDPYGDLAALQMSHFPDAVGAYFNVQVLLLGNAWFGKCVNGGAPGQAKDFVIGMLRS
jgi:hypothetical protein